MELASSSLMRRQRSVFCAGERGARVSIRQHGEGVASGSANQWSQCRSRVTISLAKGALSELAASCVLNSARVIAGEVTGNKNDTEVCVA